MVEESWEAHDFDDLGKSPPSLVVPWKNGSSIAA